MYLLPQVILFSCCTSFTLAVRRLDQIYVDQQQQQREELYTTNNEDLDFLRTEEDSNSNSNSNSKTNTRRGNEQVLPTPEDHLVTSLPYLPSSSFPTKHYAGHLPASDDGDKKLFYWMFEPDDSIGGVGGSTKPGDIPLLIWLNGGPGCSSMDGLFLENGPFRLMPPTSKSVDGSGGDGWNIDINPHSWHTAPAYVLYIDQPVGTGLSFTKRKQYCKNDLEINIDFHYFLQTFLTVYADFFLTDVDNNDTTNTMRRTMTRPLYFSGESHAGHYIPSMMDYILERNDDDTNDARTKITIDLGGAAIGNGWINPYYQYEASEYAYGIGLIDATQRQAFSASEESCHKKLLDGKLNSRECMNLIGSIVQNSYGVGSTVQVNSYDTRKAEFAKTARLFPMGHTDVEAYLGGSRRGTGYSGGMQVEYKDVLHALHAEESIAVGQKYKECTDPPYYALAHQDGLGVVEELVRVLEHPRRPRMLIFNGMADLVCHHLGNERVLLNLPWRSKEKWIVADRYAWFAEDGGKVDGSPAGFMKEFENLMFLKVRDSGHMVPMDLPVVSLDMMRTFLFSGSFKTRKQELDNKIPSLDPDSKRFSGAGSSMYFDGPVCDDSSNLFQFPSTLFGVFLGLVVACISNKMLLCRRGKKDNKTPGRHDTELTPVSNYTDRAPFMDRAQSHESPKDDEGTSAII